MAGRIASFIGLTAMEPDLLSFGLEVISKRHQARGHTMSHLHLTSLEDVMSVKYKVFPQKPYPNWTAVAVNWLAGFDFEIKVIARIPAAA
jgi:enamine deaminase RidA (YjgF/YER057c/UK114 family)